ncbi:MAG: hypothetical protein GPJ54_06170 [Candidatus Heimdallarchaeota archaeon]|nr:hypothetical protein [Candidatus Heimdallarchaeota archaeon]
MIQGLDAALNFADDIITIYIILLILPYLLRFILNWISTVFAFFFRFGYSNNYVRNNRPRNFRRAMAFITLPGTLLRITIMFVFLRLRGWSLGILYPGYVGGTERSLFSDRREGFRFFMKPDKRRRMTFKDVALISLVGYIPLYLAYLMWTNRAANLDFIIYIQQGNLSEFWIYVWYYYFFFSLFIGGAPIPEETMTPVFYLLGEYSHLILGVIGAYIIGFVLSLMEISEMGIEGKRLGYTYFMLFSAILVFKVLLNQRKYGNLTKSALDDIILGMETIELL